MTVATMDLEAASAGADLDAAFRGLGFVQIVGHGLGDATAERLWSAMDELFDLPLEVKRRHVVAEPELQAGLETEVVHELSEIPVHAADHLIGIRSQPDPYAPTPVLGSGYVLIGVGRGRNNNERQQDK